MMNRNRIPYIFIFCIFLLLASCHSGEKKESNRIPGKDSAAIALKELNKQIAADSANPDLFNQRAILYLHTHEVDLALKDIHKALQLDPEKAAYYLTIADIYLFTGKPDNSEDALNKAIKLEPENLDALLKMAKLQLIMKKYKEMDKTIERCLEVDKINPGAYYLSGLEGLEKGDTAKAVQDFRLSVDQDQKQVNAFIELGNIFAARHDPMAGDYFNNALKIQPSRVDVLYMLGMFYQEEGLFDQAITTYKRIIRIDSLYRDAWYNQGYIQMVYLKNYPEAIKLFSTAIDADSKYVKAWYNRGLAYELSGNSEKAKADYKQSLKLETNFPLAIDGLNRLDKKSH